MTSILSRFETSDFQNAILSCHKIGGLWLNLFALFHPCTFRTCSKGEIVPRTMSKNILQFRHWNCEEGIKLNRHDNNKFKAKAVIKIYIKNVRDIRLFLLEYVLKLFLTLKRWRKIDTRWWFVFFLVKLHLNYLSADAYSAIYRLQQGPFQKWITVRVKNMEPKVHLTQSANPPFNLNVLN